MADTLVWIQGTYDDVSDMIGDDYNYYYAIVTDTEGYNWITILDTEGYCDKATYTSLCNHILVIKGAYIGYSTLYDMPAINAFGFFDRETGKMINSTSLSLAYEESVKANESGAPEEEKNEGTIRTEIKEAIDTYEDFMNTYCDFLESFNKSDISMLTRYAELVSQYTEVQNQFDILGNADLNDAELAYYTEVSLRCSARLLEVSSKIS